MKKRRPNQRAAAGITLLALSFALVVAPMASAQPTPGKFRRVATFPVFLNTCDGQPEECIDEATVAEIVSASADGKTLIYTDAAAGNIGFVDISDPSNPQPGGVIKTGGEPTSVAVMGQYAIAGVNTSESYANPSGNAVVIDIDKRSVVRTMALGGQPDSVAVSPRGRYAAIVLENERNEDLCVGGTANGMEVDDDVCEDGGGILGTLPQTPPGALIVLDAAGSPASWTMKTVSLSGLADKFPSDPEPEFVDINRLNIAVVTLQENNHIVLVDLPSAKVIGDFSAGTVDLDGVDIEEDGVISLTGSLSDVPREADAVQWISNSEFATADEGDLVGGGRGFTIYNTAGKVRFTSGTDIEYLATRIGHYPEERSENKGSEPEGMEYGLFGSRRLLFVGSERGSFVAVYEVPPLGAPQYVQVLPAAVGPEGLLAIPSRNLFVAASEEDAREDTIRSTLSIFRIDDTADYPTIVSANRPDRTPIGWGALSGLGADPTDASKAYVVSDSFYSEARVYEIDLNQTPPLITKDYVISSGGKPVSGLDLEGVAVRKNGAGFWIASEGSGSCTAVGECDGVSRKNLLLMVAPNGTLRQAISLPDSVNAIQRNNGFEGVTVTGTPGVDEMVYMAFQRPWLEGGEGGDPERMVRIGRYEVATGEWTFFYYQLDEPTSPNGGWVGLSEITAIDDETFAVIERDNQAGTDARIKKIGKFSIRGLTPQPQGSEFPVVSKTTLRDILPDLEKPKGWAIEKVEGMMETAGNQVWIITDNDGVDGTQGETQFIKLGNIF